MLPHPEGLRPYGWLRTPILKKEDGPTGTFSTGFAREGVFSLHRVGETRLFQFFRKSAPTMGNLRKKRRRKIAQHKRRKRSHANRHKKRLWGA
jgi:hypothetical protein